MCAHCAGEELNAPGNLIYLERKLDGGTVASMFNFRNVIPDILVPDFEFQCQGTSNLPWNLRGRTWPDVSDGESWMDGRNEWQVIN